MYEARQNKEKVSRRIDGGMARQKVQIINKRNNAIQRTYQGKVNVSDGELYMITKDNLYTGTETTPYTRDYVNSLPDQPYEIHFDYNFDKDSAEKAAYKVINSNNYFWVNNPKSDQSYSSGNYWDAGHKLAAINGGYGDKVDEVFPQTPFINQGNSKNMNYEQRDSYNLWKSHEKAFHDGVKQKGFGSWWIKLIY